MNRRIILAALLFGSVLCMFGAYMVNTESGAIHVSNIVIPGETQISGVLYKPKWVTENAPGVLLAHGITNSKEPLSGLALELAKHGYVALSIDLAGHGQSSGSLSGSDPSLGVAQAAEYLADLPFVSGDIGLVGHSLGAGAAYYAAYHNVSESGLVLIGGGVGVNYYVGSEGFLPPQPMNVLVIIGRYDVLFDESLMERLMITLPVNTPELDQRKGTPEHGTMTMLLMPATSHLFEPIDPTVVEAAVQWFNTINGKETEQPQTYLIREALIGVALILFIAAMVLAPTLNTSTVPQTLFNGRRGAIYGIIGFITFLPAMQLGNLFPFPPQIFGSSIAWWLLVWGAVMYLIQRIWGKETDLFPRISGHDIGLGFAVFLSSYLFCMMLEAVFGFGFRLLVPIMRVLTTRRLQTFIMYIPFMLIHFYSESNWFREQTGNIRGLLLSKTGIFAAVLLLQYGGFYLLNTVFVGGFIGFILEFMMAIVPMLLISGLITTWSQQNNRIAVSVILNALIFSWIAAGLFPY
ncbi:alpha/beta fold hydrolase [Candidatus Bathyarchaeota archaeon]|nr:MAG: alpha/beta fold hydrolase [Candidatus Bathyarchaeota archaeon]